MKIKVGFIGAGTAATLEENAPELTTLFKTLEKYIVPMALAKGTIDQATAQKEFDLLR